MVEGEARSRKTNWSLCHGLAVNSVFFFFNDTATTEIYTAQYTLSLHDALPIGAAEPRGRSRRNAPHRGARPDRRSARGCPRHDRGGLAGGSSPVPRGRLGRPGAAALLSQLHAGRRALAPRDRLPSGVA